MRDMDFHQYVKEYCDNKLKVFQEKSKNFQRTFTQTAYYDIDTWYDAENDIIIEDRFYVGD